MTKTIDKPRTEGPDQGQGPRQGHFPVTWPSYEVKTKALCGKELRGEVIPPGQAEMCVVCVDMARNIVDKKNLDGRYN